MRSPSEPEYSCPSLDGAITEIEAARKIHRELREYAAWWKERAEELEAEVADLRGEHEEAVSQLKEEISEVRDEVVYLRGEREELRATVRQLEDHIANCTAP